MYRLEALRHERVLTTTQPVVAIAHDAAMPTPCARNACRINPSLGSAETTLIRRINRAANEQLEPAYYRPLVRELVAHQTLSRRTGTPRLALPPDAHPWALALEEAWIAEIRARGYDVIGDLDDLRGAPPVAEYADPDHPDEALVSGAAVDALKAVMLDHARLQRTLA